MRAEIITIGTELLLGQIINTNSKFLSEELAGLGFDLFYQSTVGDNRVRLLELLETASKRSDLIIISGGLGPTKDDITRETLAEFLARPLLLDESYPFDNKQAYIIDGAIALANKFGTAPGQFIRNKDQAFLLLPGPPRELQPMFISDAGLHIRDLIADASQVIYSEELSFFGIGESSLEASIIDLIDSQSNPSLVTLIGDNLVRVRLTAKAASKERARELIAPIARQVKERNKAYYFTNNGQSLIAAVHKKLIDKKLSISVAESCTGGSMSAKLTELAGSSEFFYEGVAVYSNQAKNRLGVAADLITRHGAVSEEVALLLSELIRKKSSSDIGIGITGIAGPGGGSEEKPVGLVYFSIDFCGRLYPYKLLLKGDRTRIISLTVSSVLFELFKLLND